MATAKICGIETEYGIVIRGAGESNPIAASSLLINAYVNDLGEGERQGPAPKVGWDFEDESPGNDARGDAPDDSLAPEVETHLVNAVLTNGARFYVDHAHPELSTPECADARSVVVWDKAAEAILIRAMRASARSLPEGQEIVVYKNNSDGKGNSYGCHENYLMDRDVPFARIVTHVMPHFITRQSVHRCGEGGHRGEWAVQRRGALPAHAASRLLRGGGRAGDHAQATHRQHAGRAPRRRPEVPAAPRHLRRRQPVPRSPRS